MSYDIGIVEDDDRVRGMLDGLLRQVGDHKVAFAVGSAEQALERMEADAVDLVVVDLGLPAMGGIEFIHRVSVKWPAVQCLVLTVFADEQSLFDALRAGALGYLTKDTPPDGIVEAIEELRDGGSPMSPGIARRVVRAFTQPPPEAAIGADGGLTPREREILTALAQGYTYQNVAACLSLSSHTVHSHIRNIYRKLQVNSRSEAVYEALRRRLLDLG